MCNRFHPIQILICAVLIGLAGGAHAASIGSTGYTNDFSTPPSAADWSYLNLAGAAANIGTAADLNTAVQAVTASSINMPIGSDPGDPPLLNGAALWSSVGLYLQTRPTGNNAILLMCTLVNNLGGDAASVTISYDFAKVAPAPEEIEGHQAYYSLTGAAGSWVPIPQFSSALPGKLTATVNINWPGGATLYLLWADDNGSPSPDTACQIDNVSITATPAAQTPVTITSQPQSQTVAELSPASFTVGLAGYPPPTIQWYRNNAPITDATNASYFIASAALSDSGAQFKLIAANTASNVNYAVTSSVVVLTVNADTNAPMLLHAFGSPPTTVHVEFSEPVSLESANFIGNYAITSPVGNLTISGAVLAPNGTNVTLTTSAQTIGATYTVIVNGIHDRSVASNQIAPNSFASFTNLSYTATDIGSPQPAGTVAVAGNGYRITVGGADIGGTNDQLTFNYQVISGDFDMKLRVEGLTGSDAWTKAGWMARESLNANSRFAAALATPGVCGAVFESRIATGLAATAAGSFPVNYPNTWLRLQRAGSTFTGFASIDGDNWMRLGALTMTNLPSAMFLGMVVSSHTNGVPTTAEFRDLMQVSGGTVGTVTLPIEPAGPSSRRTPFAITEINYNPFPSTNALGSLEFIEIYNSNPFWEEISGYRLSGDIDYTFPLSTYVLAGQYIVVARNPAALQAAYNLSGVPVFGPYATTNTLKSSGTVRLRNKEDAILLEIPYSSDPPWPSGADGAGHSLVLARPTYGEGSAAAWALSDQLGGSPGRIDGYTGRPQRNVVINEFLANSQDPDVDWVELYNHSNTQVDISGCTLSDEARTNKFVLPANTLIPPRGFLVFYQTQLGFGLSSGGETIYFRDAGGRVLDCVRFEAQAAGVTSGRFPDGATEFYPLTAPTPGAANAGILIRDIVINEIMYKPISRDSSDEYVELYNKGTNAVSLTGWRFTAGIDFTFPSNVVMAPDSYLVIAKDAQHLMGNYANLNSANTLGNFDGSLKNSGERVALTMPDTEITTNSLGQVKTNKVHIVVDEVTYGIGGNWGNWASEGGSSLELIDPRSNHRLAHNWGDSDETHKAPWTLVEATGFMDNGAGAANLFEVLSLGEGEYLLDDAQVIPSSTGTNALTTANSNFESGIGGWLPRGTHIRSTLETTEGHNSSRSLHIRASDRGDTQHNRAVVAVATLPTGGSAQVTLRAYVRWLRGWPEILLRVHGNWMEAYGRLAVPANLGTPGQRNSRALTNAPPAIYAVQHTPVVPAAGEPVVVTARVHDSDGLASIVLKYRIDPSQTIASVPMLDNGTGGDSLAGDGIYSATISGQSSNTLVAFTVVATDTLGAVRTFPLQDASYKNPFECLVYFGDTSLPTGFGTYRQWMSVSNINDWMNRPALSNEQLDETFVYGNFRAIYNTRVKWAGSPYHQFGGTPANDGHYVIDMPADNTCLGTASWHKVHMPGNGPGDDNTIQREQTCFWWARQMGLPWNYRRCVNMFFNGFRRGGTTLMMEDTETPGNDFVNSRFPDDSNGNLYKLQPWFEVDDGSARSLGFANQSWALMNKFTTSSNGVPVHKTARYRHNYLTRAANGTANDYTPVFSLVEAADTPTTGWTAHTDAINSQINIEEWTRIWSVCHAAGDWDHYGTQNAQNMYGYKTASGKWTLAIWDMNIVLGNSGSWTPGQNLIGTFTPVENRMQNIYANPTFRRMFFRAFKELANGPMVAGTDIYGGHGVEPLMDAKYAAFVASGVTPTSPSASVKLFIQQQRTAILSAVAIEEAQNFAVSGPTSYSTNGNLITISGTAPLTVGTIKVTINGVTADATWSSVANWSFRTIAVPGVNLFAIQGYDLTGAPISSVNASVSVNYTGPTPRPQDFLVFSEIMYAPVISNATYVEIANTSTNFGFDLSGWRVDGLDYTFPRNSILTPKGFIVLTKSRVSYGQAYPNSPAPFAEFPGVLDPAGETLALVKPGATPGLDIVVDKVHYESQAPWPAAASGQGAALQIIDPSQDNARVSDWSDGLGWRFVSITGNLGASSNVLGTNVLLYLQGAGEAYVDDVALVPLSGPYAGSNLVQNADFEATPLTDTWIVPPTMGNSDISTTYAHSGSNSLHLVATNGGSLANSVRQVLPPVDTNTICTLSFWYRTLFNTNVVGRTFPGSAINTNVNVRPISTTPNAANATLGSLPPYPLLWLNEVQANNVSGPTDSFGQHDPWIELYNSGTNALSLSGYYLANNYTNLAQWAFPASAVIGPGQFLIVWGDGQDLTQTGPTEWHTSFRLNSSSGSVALVRRVDGAPQIMDYLNYSGLTADQSYGDYPDGQPFDRQIFYTTATPGTNNYVPPPNVLINEWMASNAAGPGGYPDPSDGKYDDWFELYNAGTQPANIGGFYLTDDLNNKLQWRIPNGTIIPAGGFLLVWADNDVNANGGTNDLHANFNLSKTGEALGLFALNGTNIIQVDAVTFGAQTTDVSMGRFPDGAAGIFGLTTPTPRAPNAGVGNRFPVLSAIANRTLLLGQTLNFTATATDPDAGQILTYSLAIFPTGASIDASGHFQWTPDATQAPSTNQITARVTDNGLPNLSDSKSFTVIVALPPLATLTQSGASVSLSFPTISGKTYRIDYKDNLGAATWTPLAPSFVANSSSKTVNDTIGAHRFYRIVALD